MHALNRKIAVFASLDGLVLQPVKQHNQRATSSLLINYSTKEIAPLSFTSHFDTTSCEVLEAHGIIGFFEVAAICYAIFISQRRQVAQIRGAPIYVITGVAFVPLNSQSTARQTIIQAADDLLKNSGSQRNQSPSSSETSDNDQDLPKDGVLQNDPVPSPESPVDLESMTSATKSDTSTSIAKDVISRKGEYGRLANKWLSGRGWSTEKLRSLGMSNVVNDSIQAQDASATDTNSRSLTDESVTEEKEKTLPESISSQNGILSKLDKTSSGEVMSSSQKVPILRDHQASSNQDAARKLLPKMLRITKVLLCSGSFFFSYDFDISKRLGTWENIKSEIPFHKSVDPLFFWNHFLARSLIDGGYHAYVLPLIQGFVGQQAFTIRSNPETLSSTILESQEGIIDDLERDEPGANDRKFLITLISRRFITRPGLRYLRRGIDDKGHTANSVETEQLLSHDSWTPFKKIHSFTQIRGSIPLFFSQNPYSFKPVPTLQHSFEINHAAFRRHFKSVAVRYGAIQVASLVDKTGGEAEIGKQYEIHMKKLNDESGIGGAEIGFEHFDFHENCRGFQYANISLLMKTIGETMDLFSCTVEVDGKIQKKQNGVLRTNCMDCLDRTNVVQSACAQIALQKQLREEGLEADFANDTSTEWFNMLWANNGDAISKQYSSTAALKGDYTRTRKRNYRGVINDFSLTLSRYFHNIVNDYFSQAAIDFLTGNVTAQVFEDFELNMTSQDPAISMEKLRANAIDTSSRIVIIDPDEDLIEGWTLLTPHQQNTIRTFPLEETVLLLTNAAIYAVRFDWNMEKVSSFERVHLRSLIGITQGTYITSILTSTQTDADRNFGLVIRYRPTKEDVSRTNTRSLNTTAPPPKNPTAAHNQEKPSSGLSRVLEDFMAPRDTTPRPKILAFKAIAARSSFATAEPQPTHLLSEGATVTNICATIEKAARDAEARDDNRSDREHSTLSSFTEHRDIISLQEARKSTGLLEQWGHSLKKMVWA